MDTGWQRFLTISDSGAMVNYDYSNKVPWKTYINTITTVMVVIKNDVTKIGNHAFYNCTSLTNVAYEGASNPGTNNSNVFAHTNISTVKVSSGYQSDKFYNCSVVRTYIITVNAAENGTITTPISAAADETVILTMNPETGYGMFTLSAKNANDNNEVTVNNNQFAMPEGNVTVTATFANISAFKTLKISFSEIVMNIQGDLLMYP